MRRPTDADAEKPRHVRAEIGPLAEWQRAFASFEVVHGESLQPAPQYRWRRGPLVGRGRKGADE